MLEEGESESGERKGELKNPKARRSREARGGIEDIIALIIVTLTFVLFPFIGFFLIMSILFTLFHLVSPLLFGGNLSFLSLGKWGAISGLLGIVFYKIKEWVKVKKTPSRLKSLIQQERES